MLVPPCTMTQSWHADNRCVDVHAATALLGLCVQTNSLAGCFEGSSSNHNDLLRARSEERRDQREVTVSTPYHFPLHKWSSSHCSPSHC